MVITHGHRGNGIEVDGGRDYPTQVVVGMIASKLCTAGSGEQRWRGLGEQALMGLDKADETSIHIGLIEGIPIQRGVDLV
ncbi:hypothetical protein SDC9_85569 [bioreactor metagenome]|uniref:Uncharacterized protein n=1 Tax=bioreactor metagenome TaxID=1076179 RepID=A0A644ZF65_9ZZZZ